MYYVFDVRYAPWIVYMYLHASSILYIDVVHGKGPMYDEELYRGLFAGNQWRQRLGQWTQVNKLLTHAEMRTVKWSCCFKIAVIVRKRIAVLMLWANGHNTLYILYFFYSREESFLLHSLKYCSITRIKNTNKRFLVLWQRRMNGRTMLQ